MIPKIYNGKDKTFFFGGFQRHHEKVTETFIGTGAQAGNVRWRLLLWRARIPHLRSGDDSPRRTAPGRAIRFPAT